MKWLRLSLVAILCLENILIPFTYTQAATGDIPIVEINYQTKDNITPEATEYVQQVNAAATNGKLYSFYTLSGVVKTVKALEKGGSDVPGEEKKGYFHTGDGAPGYLIIAYDVISGKSLSYKDWIAATTTNENGKFALPIEKTNSGVFIVVLKRDGENFRFITSYDVASSKTNRATVYPENGLNIGVIEIPEENKDIGEYIEDLPNSVKVLDEENYWACGEPSKIIYKDEDYNTSATVKIPLTDSSFVGNKISWKTVKDVIDGNDTTDKIPAASKTPFKDVKTGRMSITRGDNYTGTMSTLNFYNGVVNRAQPTRDATGIPSCAEFLKSRHLNTTDYNKNYYTYNGMSAMVLPGAAERKIADLEIQEDTLKATIACRDLSGKNKTYYDLLGEGYGSALLSEFFQDENFEKQYTYMKTQEKAENDSMLAGEQDDQPREVPFPTKEEADLKGSPDPRGESPSLGEYTTMKPKKNQVTKIYSETFDAEPQGQAFNVPFLQPDEKGIFVYELGPFKELCAESAVQEGGKNIAKNEELKGSLDEYNRVTEGYLLTTKDLEAYKDGGTVTGSDLPNVKYYKDTLKENVVLSFLSNLITVFQGWLSPDKPLSRDCFTVTDYDNYTKLTGTAEEAKAECETIQKEYGLMACEEIVIDDTTTPPKMEYRRYNEFEYSCTGKEDYPLKVVSEQIEDGNTQLKTKPSSQGTLIRDSFSLGTSSETPILIGKSTMELIEVTGAKDSPIMRVKREIDSIATDTLDYLRFSATLPDGTENKAKEYNTAVVRLIDRTARSEGETDSYIYAGGGGSGGGTGERPGALDTPLPCPIGGGSCGAAIGCASYPYCHGSNKYWEGMTPCAFFIPSLTGAKGPLDPSSICYNQNPKKPEYGYALDVSSTCGEKSVYAPIYGDLTEWKVTAVAIAAEHQSFVDVEGVSSGKTIKLRFLHMGNIFVSPGSSVVPGESIGIYDEWVLGGIDNSHVHIEMLIEGQAVPPEDNLQCGEYGYL